jgi:serine/threonine-protein kinase
MPPPPQEDPWEVEDPSRRSERVSGARLAAGPAHEYREGEQIAEKYRLVRVIGAGGMGAVWLAENLTLDVQVAIKLMRRDVASPEMHARLLLEARSAARLGHPSIVRVFDFGETQHGDPYIVMEVLEGESLGHVLTVKGRLPATSAVRTLLPVASALATAHQKGIVHRDLKPDNILLVRGHGGAIVPKLVDFGIAKFRRDEEPEGITRAGMMVGSPEYMSPEQARGRSDIDERADVWGLAVVLYECITGVRPFEAPNVNALMVSIAEDPPIPCTDFCAGDAELWAILERALAKRTADRWPTMRELGAALTDWCEGVGVTTDIVGTSLRVEGYWPSADPRGSLHERLSATEEPVPTPAPRSLRRRSAVSTASELVPRTDPPPPTPHRSTTSWALWAAAGGGLLLGIAGLSIALHGRGAAPVAPPPVLSAGKVVEPAPPAPVPVVEPSGEPNATAASAAPSAAPAPAQNQARPSKTKRATGASAAPLAPKAPAAPRGAVPGDPNF